jgi:hypothetical protein
MILAMQWQKFIRTRTQQIMNLNTKIKKILNAKQWRKGVMQKKYSVMVIECQVTSLPEISCLVNEIAVILAYKKL